MMLIQFNRFDFDINGCFMWFEKIHALIELKINPPPRKSIPRVKYCPLIKKLIFNTADVQIKCINTLQIIQYAQYTI